MALFDRILLKGRGLFHLYQFLGSRKQQMKQRQGSSPQERQALELVRETCSQYRGRNIFSPEDLRFLPDTLSLISQIACIYHPSEKAPLEKARIGKLFAVFQEMNRQIFNVIEIHGLEELARFRLREVLSKGTVNKSIVFWVPDFLRRRIRLMMMRTLWVYGLQLVGESAIKVYAEYREDEAPEPEVLLAEMDQLQDKSDPSFPEEVHEIIETSRKNVLFSVKPLVWADMKPLYISLVENISRAWHPESSLPLYEVRVYDLLKSLARYLEWAGKLSQKPVLNKMLGLRVSHIIGVKEVVIPFAGNTLVDWTRKFQVGRAAKWAKTIYKTLQKKQPRVLFHDVAAGIVKEGGKRWLALYFHDKIADETNRLYKNSQI